MINIIEKFVDPAEYLVKPMKYRQLPATDVWYNRVAELDEFVGLPLLQKIHDNNTENRSQEVWADTVNFAVW